MNILDGILKQIEAAKDGDSHRAVVCLTLGMVYKLFEENPHIEDIEELIKRICTKGCSVMVYNTMESSLCVTRRV